MSRPRISPLAFLPAPTHTPPPPLKSIDVEECGLHPKLGERGQVNLGVEEPKKKFIYDIVRL